jgi:hypothetical protein
MKSISFTTSELFFIFLFHENINANYMFSFKGEFQSPFLIKKLSEMKKYVVHFKYVIIFQSTFKKD